MGAIGINFDVCVFRDFWTKKLIEFRNEEIGLPTYFMIKSDI